jgi:hypothetical protein
VGRGALTLVLALAACGGGGPSRASRVSSSASLTPTEIRALLARYSPESHAVVTAYEALSGTFELPEGPYTITSDDTFDGYLRDGAIPMLVTYTTTAVHETTHGYIGDMAYQLLAERGLRREHGAIAIPGVDGPRLVHLTPGFPSIELDATFPADARTDRYAQYITSDNPNLGTQVMGVYGILDEYAAYYQGARATLDFWPWVRDEAPSDTTLAMNYAVLVDEIERAYADVTLYLLHYLRHARVERPDVHAAIVANADFRAAFLAVHDRFAALVTAAAALQPEMIGYGRSRGVELAWRDGHFLIDGNPQRPEQADAIAAARAYLAGETYQAELAGLHPAP